MSCTPSIVGYPQTQPGYKANSWSDGLCVSVHKISYAHDK